MVLSRACCYPWLVQVVPVFNYRRVDLLMRQWDIKQGQLEAAKFRYTMTRVRPQVGTKGCGRGEKASNRVAESLPHCSAQLIRVSGASVFMQ